MLIHLSLCKIGADSVHTAVAEVHLCWELFMNQPMPLPHLCGYTLGIVGPPFMQLNMCLTTTNELDNGQFGQSGEQAQTN